MDSDSSSETLIATIAAALGRDEAELSKLPTEAVVEQLEATVAQRQRELDNAQGRVVKRNCANRLKQAQGWLEAAQQWAGNKTLETLLEEGFELADSGKRIRLLDFLSTHRDTFEDCGDPALTQRFKNLEKISQSLLAPPPPAPVEPINETAKEPPPPVVSEPPPPSKPSISSEERERKEALERATLLLEQGESLLQAAHTAALAQWVQLNEIFLASAPGDIPQRFATIQRKFEQQRQVAECELVLKEGEALADDLSRNDDWNRWRQRAQPLLSTKGTPEQLERLLNLLVRREAGMMQQTIGPLTSVNRPPEPEPPPQEPIAPEPPPPPPPVVEPPKSVVEKPTSPPEKTEPPQPVEPPQPTKSVEQPKLPELFSIADAPLARLHLTRGETLRLGRIQGGQGAELELFAVAPGDMRKTQNLVRSISRRHARIRLTEGKWLFEDGWSREDATSGTFVGDRSYRQVNQINLIDYDQQVLVFGSNDPRSQLPAYRIHVFTGRRSETASVLLHRLDRVKEHIILLGDATVKLPRELNFRKIAVERGVICIDGSTLDALKPGHLVCQGKLENLPIEPLFGR